MNNVKTKLAAAEEYAAARHKLLEVCRIPDSCRDPLNEFAEVLVADLLDGTMANSRVEKGFDLIKPDGRRVQVKSLSNPEEATWRNEITMRFDDLVDDFALVIFEGLRIRTVRMPEFTQRFRFADWPNSEVPMVAAGNYAIWDGDVLIYCGMAGRELEEARIAAKPRYGLVLRLASHASGRLSGDQFCVYVANRLVFPR